MLSQISLLLQLPVYPQQTSGPLDEVPSSVHKGKEDEGGSGKERAGGREREGGGESGEGDMTAESTLGASAKVCVHTGERPWRCPGGHLKTGFRTRSPPGDTYSFSAHLLYSCGLPTPENTESPPPVSGQDTRDSVTVKQGTFPCGHLAVNSNELYLHEAKCLYFKRMFKIQGGLVPTIPRRGITLSPLRKFLFISVTQETCARGMGHVKLGHWE